MATATPAASKKDDIKPNVRKTHEIKPEQVKEGHIMAFIYYARVRAVHHGGNTLSVEGLTKGAPREFGVDGASLVTGALSADQFQETVMMSMSDVAHILATSFNVPFSVCFTKKDGTERVLRGRLIGEEPHTGFTWVEDLEKPDGDRIREVNVRELKWMIVGGVKYQVRGRK